MVTFSVLISVYHKDNCGHLKECFDSILSQTLVPNEIVVVKDGRLSTELDALIDNYKQDYDLFKIIPLAINGGLANALNKGILECSNVLIARMDADDICFSDRFEKQIAYFSDYEVDILGGQIIEFGKDKNDVISRRVVPLEHNEIVKFMKFRSPFSHPSIMFKKSVFENLGGYDSSFFPEDYLLFVKAYLRGYRLANLQDDILWFRVGQNYSNSLRRRWGVQYAKNELKLYCEFYKLGFYSVLTLAKVLFFKVPLRLIPFPLFKLVYYKFLR